jgi:hypothetical protein
MSDFWEEEHEHDDNETDDGGSDWKTENEINPFEEFILDFLENILTKKFTDLEAIRFIADAVIERDWYSEQAETEATTAVFAMAYSATLGAQITPQVAKNLSDVIKRCIAYDIKAESERN